MFTKELFDRPVFEVIDRDTGHSLCIWADGHVEVNDVDGVTTPGSTAIIINRIPHLMSHVMSAMAGFAMYASPPKPIVFRDKDAEAKIAEFEGGPKPSPFHVQLSKPVARAIEQMQIVEDICQNTAEIQEHVRVVTGIEEISRA